MTLRKTLRKGAKGQLVSELQKLLNKILASSKVTADGIVGKGTWAALANATTKVIKTPVQLNGLSDIAA